MGEFCKSCGVSGDLTRKVLKDLGDFVEDAMIGRPEKGEQGWERCIAVTLGIPEERVDTWLDCQCGKEGE